jgi:hypothetical protein
MRKPVFWLPEAILTYNQNILFLRDRWYEAVVDDFKIQVERHLDFIAETPNLFRVHNKEKQIHKCLVVKQITLYYRILDDKIELLTFWNNYQNPKKLRV